MDNVVGSAAPRQIGRFRIDSLLGRGGMGEVYRGYDPVLCRDVALKVVRSDLARPEFLQRLLREALACARLQHPRIVTIYEACELDGYVYIAMEFLKGAGLEVRVRSGAPSTDVAIGILHEVLDALAHAHEAGVVHRDIKPSNVHLLPDGSIKLLDFGLARVADAQPLTRLGEAMGTAHYASPEQLNGAATDQRTDIYSTGVLAYELFTGRRPFGVPGDSLGAIVAKVLTHAVPALDTDVSRTRPEFDRFIARALAKRPEDRFATAREMSVALAALRHDRRGASIPLLDREAGTVLALASEVASPAAGAAGRWASESTTEAPAGWRLRPALGGGVAAAAAVGVGLWLGTFLTRAPGLPGPATQPPLTAGPLPSSEPETPRTGTVRPKKDKPRDRLTMPGAIRDASAGIGGGLQGAERPGGAQASVALQSLLAPVPARVSEEPIAVPTVTEASAPAPIALDASSPQATTPRAPAAADALLPGDEAAIRALLQAFEAAFANQSTPELRRLQPALDSRQLALYDSRFLGSRAFVVELQDPRFRLLAAGRVLVSCTIQRDITLDDETHRRHSGRATVIVERSDAHWRVAAFQPPAWW